jgi:hypothetical protein
MSVTNLREIQNLLYRLIVAPSALNRDNEYGELSYKVERLVRGGRGLRASERINIYANAYFYRLLECLREEFPATLAVIGSNDFADLTRDYLLWRPPTEPSLFYAGRYLAECLCHHSLAQRWPFIAELARLERATLETFHAPDAPTLTDDAMCGIPPEQWPTTELRAHPAVEILGGEWRVSEVLRAVESGDEWGEPTHETTTVIVWRQGTQVHYRIVEDAETDALLLLQKGAGFAAICDAIAAAASNTDPVALIGRLLARWLADGIIEGTDTRPAESAAAP